MWKILLEEFIRTHVSEQNMKLRSIVFYFDTPTFARQEWIWPEIFNKIRWYVLKLRYETHAHKKLQVLSMGWEFRETRDGSCTGKSTHTLTLYVFFFPGVLKIFRSPHIKRLENFPVLWTIWGGVRGEERGRRRAKSGFWLVFEI